MNAQQPGQGSVRIPRATYRLQFGESFRFVDASGLIGYLEALGISDVYASPIFPTPKGSAHGYNGVAFDQPNPVLGSSEEFVAFASALKERGMGLLLDIVPNHMAADGANRWWWDVLQFGSESSYANYFEIDWQRHNGKVFLPILGGSQDEVIERRELRVGFEQGAFSLQYFERRLPLSPEATVSMLDLLSAELARRKHAAAASAVDRRRRRLRHSPLALEYSTDELARNNDRAYDAAVADALDRVNGSPEALRELLAKQNYVLGFWHDAAAHVNYRRFFDINDLVGLRVERAEVFHAAHAELLRWIHAGWVTGVRVDHPDGLRDPAGYLEDLQSASRVGEGTSRNIYLLVEKIITDGEELRHSWPVHGTTGYDFLIPLNQLFVDSRSEQKFDALYRTFYQRDEVFPAVEEIGKEHVLEHSFQGNLQSLAEQLSTLARSDQRLSRVNLEQWISALAEFVCSFPVYRTYIDPYGAVAPEDAQVVQAAIAKALHRGKADPPALAFLEDVFLLRRPVTDSSAEFIWRFQQFSGPLTAKGVEDTAFYRYYRFASLNEVGGNPGRFGMSADEVHRWIARHATRWPHAMLTTATHDTKRGEDLRARLNVLSEFAEEWEAQVQQWSALAASAKGQAGGREAPDSNDEYLFYQTVVGAWGFSPELPNLAERISAYMLKAAKERKELTSWTNRNAAYERALDQFVTQLLTRENEFTRSVSAFVDTIALFGVLNSLAQTTIKATAPGVPDFYQGCEFWDFSLVDPDNRRPVEFLKRTLALKECLERLENGRAEFLKEMLANFANGRIKLFVIQQLLQLRRMEPALFADGSYVPLRVSGAWHDRIFAFARENGGRRLIVLVPRCAAEVVGKAARWPLGEAWADTHMEIPEAFGGEYQEIFTLGNTAFGVKAKVSELLTGFPLGVFISR